MHVFILTFYHTRIHTHAHTHASHIQDAEAEISWEIDDDFGGEGVEMEEDITITTRGGEVDGITVSSQSPGVMSGPTFQVCVCVCVCVCGWV